MPARFSSRWTSSSEGVQRFEHRKLFPHRPPGLVSTQAARLVGPEAYRHPRAARCGASEGLEQERGLGSIGFYLIAQERLLTTTGVNWTGTN